MNVGHMPSPTKPPAKSILLMDSNAERRALRRRILGLHGIEVIGAGDLAEASSIWHRDRYDLVLIDIRRDYRGCVAWRDEIEKENPKQIVAFLVGQPHYLDLHPLPDSYLAEEHSGEWGNLLRHAVRSACSCLPQRNGFAEVGYRIALARKMSGLPPRGMEPADDAPEQVVDDSILHSSAAETQT
jgi:hypothetical protein